MTTRPSMMRREIYISVLIGVLTIVGCNIAGHFIAGFSILLAPFYMPLIFRTINENLYEYSFTKTVIYNSALLLINDLLIRFLAAGDHDQEGKIWISQFFMITFIFSYIAMLFKSSKNKDPKDEGSIDVLFCALFTGIIYFVFMTNI